jgi:hypothetical protein
MLGDADVAVQTAGAAALRAVAAAAGKEQLVLHVVAFRDALKGE